MFEGIAPRAPIRCREQCTLQSGLGCSNILAIFDAGNSSSAISVVPLTDWIVDQACKATAVICGVVTRGTVRSRTGWTGRSRSTAK